MKLTGAQTVAIADFADGEDLTIYEVSARRGTVRVVVENERSAMVDTDGTIIASSGIDWKRMLGKNLTLTV